MTHRYRRLRCDRMTSTATDGSGHGTRSGSRRDAPRGGPPFELSELKLHPPRISERSVLRRRLVDRLRREERQPIVVLCAGPGYGKTTALAQWAASEDPRRFAWVSVDQHDNDPVVLLTYV